VLTTDPTVRPTDRLLAILHRPAHLDDRAPTPAWPPPPGAILRLHLGTESVEATRRRGRADAIELADGRWVATLRLIRPIATTVGDPFVLRVPSPPVTAAGGLVLDATPPTGPSRRRATPEMLAALAEAWLADDEPAELAARVAFHGLIARPDAAAAPATARAAGSWLVAEEVAAALDTEMIGLVDAHHAAEPLAAGRSLAQARRSLARSLGRRVTADERTAVAVADALIEALVASGRLARSGDLVRDPGRSTGTLPPSVLAAMDRLEMALRTFAPPPLDDAARAARCPAEGVRALEAAGRIVRVGQGLAWAASTYRELEALTLRLADPGPISPAALRDATGTSRKYVMALLEDLDRRGILRRTSDGHVRGPRAPA
jgi:selenocysteine-specific elongation factor